MKASFVERTPAPTDGASQLRSPMPESPGWPRPHQPMPAGSPNTSCPASMTRSSPRSRAPWERAPSTARSAAAVKTGGGVKGWGYNQFGQLGDGTNADSAVPVDVTGLQSGVGAIDTRGEHTCALMTGGSVKCWGANINGQLGDGTTASSDVPVGVVGLSSGVSAIAVGGEHTCALTTGGGVKCWGWNAKGQLGTGTTTDSNTP